MSSSAKNHGLIVVGILIVLFVVVLFLGQNNKSVVTTENQESQEIEAELIRLEREAMELETRIGN